MGLENLEIYFCYCNCSQDGFEVEVGSLGWLEGRAVANLRWFSLILGLLGRTYLSHWPGVEIEEVEAC